MLKKIGNIQQKHLENQLLYPRPTLKCTECNNKLVLCWGESIRTPYWRHRYKYSQSKCGYKGGESAMHMVCKALLCNYLEKNKHINISYKCTNCNDVISEKIHYQGNPATEIRYVTANGDKSVFDVMTRVGNLPELGFEIKYTNYTKNIIGRENISWYEFDAHNVYDLLYADENIMVDNGDVIFTDLRRHQCKKPGCYNIRDYASLLKYLEDVSPYKYLCEKVLNIYASGKYLHNNKEYVTYPINKSSNSIWKKFLSHQKCIRCYHETNTVYAKPYCKQCWCTIKYDDDAIESGDAYIVDDDCIIEIKKSMDYIFEIYNLMEFSIGCVECGAMSWIKINSDILCCCFECMDSLVNKHNVYDKISDISYHTKTNDYEPMVFHEQVPYEHRSNRIKHTDKKCTSINIQNQLGVSTTANNMTNNIISHPIKCDLSDDIEPIEHNIANVKVEFNEPIVIKNDPNPKKRRRVYPKIKIKSDSNSDNIAKQYKSIFFNTQC